ncbi:WLM domain-containing protein [Stachybotrys elegans]|uniref:WLM domain-containing protein n=1 Tax=Stachybotrys elegans TaxID=80388 RepID=A0A8K0WSD1_9HYPO|nr:WLM domain-containing protein [Stachybotrys elegans]
MVEHDPLVFSYVHLAQFPRADDALRMLKKIASLVKPIMRARNWRVGELAEFYPDQPNLLGLNVNRGHKICLRLRYPGDRTLFLPMENVIDTMLHELSHNVHGPHDSKFHALWDQLRDEHQGLVMKGYTGEGFLSDGRRLGGRAMPPREVRRVAREAAEKRRARPSGTGGGQRLGGAAPRPEQDIRNVIVQAVERRNTTLRGCATDQLSDVQIHNIADTATRNGFRTQAEEDEANEAAIAQALWELVQEDEQAKYGQSYIPPSAENPIGNGGGAVMPAGVSSRGAPAAPGASRSRAQDSSVDVKSRSSSWACEICTLHNPPEYLCCDACGVEKPERPAPVVPPPSSRPPAARSTAATIDLTGSPPTGKGKGKDRSKMPSSRAARAESSTASSSRPAAPAVPQTWHCRFCGTEMERKWWTCSTCGLMKDSSR